MSAIYTYGQWIDIVDRGTSGDQVMDILASWKVNAYKLLEDNHKLESRIAELEAERRWIPVSERLPKEKQSVLALDRTGTAYHWEYSRSLSNIFVSDYTHWMPLPEPPEVKE